MNSNQKTKRDVNNSIFAYSIIKNQMMNPCHQKKEKNTLSYGLKKGVNLEIGRQKPLNQNRTFCGLAKVALVVSSELAQMFRATFAKPVLAEVFLSIFKIQIYDKF
jgi:hypothetical protein